MQNIFILVIIIYLHLCLTVGEFKIFRNLSSILMNNQKKKESIEEENVNAELDTQYKNKKAMQLLTSIMPILPRINEDPNNQNEQGDFNIDLVMPLTNYMFFVKGLINSKAKNFLQPINVNIIIDDITLDEKQIVPLLQYYYEQSKDITSNNVFKTYWFSVDVKHLWNSYKTNKNSIKEFQQMFKEIFSCGNNKFKLQDKNQIKRKPNIYDKIKETLNNLKQQLYATAKSKLNIIQHNYHWLSIKHLSMQSFMKFGIFYKLPSIEVKYHNKVIHLKDAYEIVLSTMDTYALVKSYSILMAMILEQFNKYLVNICLTYKEIYNTYLDHTRPKDDFIVIQNYVTLTIKSFVKLFKMYFASNFETLFAENTRDLYEFMTSSLHENDLESLKNTYKRLFKQWTITNAKLDSEENSSFSTDYSVEKGKKNTTENEVEYLEENSTEEDLQHFQNKPKERLLSDIYKFLANNVSNELCYIDCVLDIAIENSVLNDKKDEIFRNDNMYEVNMRTAFNQSIKQLTRLQFSTNWFLMYTNNLAHMGLVIAHYTCAIAKTLKIKSQYIIYPDGTLNESNQVIRIDNIDYDQNNERK